MNKEVIAIGADNTEDIMKENIRIGFSKSDEERRADLAEYRKQNIEKLRELYVNPYAADFYYGLPAFNPDHPLRKR